MLVCTHTDCEHIHSHCIINSVNFETGRKVHIADKQIQELRVRNDQICEELGLPKFQKDEQRQSRGMSNAEYYTAVRGESWKFELMRVIDECMRCAGSREEFLILLRSEGYDATWTESRKNIIYTTPDGRKCRDSKLHIEKYMKKKIWRKSLDTEQRMTTQEMLTQHKKLMDEAQQLETSVMVTERNWSALLEMQDRLFRQQMQLNANLKKLLTKAGSTEPLTEMQESAEKFERQAGNLNEKYSSGCKTLTESTKLSLTAILNDTKKQLSNTVQETRKKIRTCAWISITAVILCATLCALAVLWSR